MPAFDLLTTALVILGVFGGVMGFCAYAVLAERKIAAWVQDRLGPNRVGPWGLLQPLADGGKLFLKEDVIPSHVDKVFFVLAPAVSVGTALLAIAVVPVGKVTPPPAPVAMTAAAPAGTAASPVAQFEAGQKDYQEKTQLAIAPGLDIGVLYLFALGSLAVYGVILAGWSANNKYSLLGSLRSSAQIISYEIPLGMSILGVVLMAGTLQPEGFAAWQAKNGWFIFFQPLAFLLFLTSVYAECNRLPFDLPEAEQELVGGYHTEYSNSMKLGLLLLSEYVHLVTTSLLVAVAFLGGHTFFGLERLSADPVVTHVLGHVILAAKMTFLIGVAMVVRWTIPRFRFDQLMNIAWKVMTPLAILNLVCVMAVKQLNGSAVVLTVTSLALFVAAGWLSVRARGTVTNPKRPVAKLPPGLPQGVTYAS